MCNPISFSMRRIAGKPPTFLLHKTKPLVNHSHTAIADSHGIHGLAQDTLVKWEYRPYYDSTVNTTEPVRTFLKSDQIKPDTPFDLIKDSHHDVTKSEWDAALAFAKSLVPRYLRRLARKKIEDARRQKAQARADARAALVKDRLDRLHAALNHKRHTSNNILPRTRIFYNPYSPNKPCAWERRFKLRNRTQLLTEHVGSDGSWYLVLLLRNLPTTNNLNREVAAFLIRTTTLSFDEFYFAVLNIHPNQITAPNLDLWFRELVRLIGYKKPIPGGSGF